MEALSDVTWLGHASFYFTEQTTGTRIYYVDPFELTQPDLPHGDLIFITHAHPDHLSPQDIAKIVKDESVIIAPPDCLTPLSLPEKRRFPVEPNQAYTIKDFSFQTIPAYNAHPEKAQFHPKANNWVGYIFHLNGKKIYHAGDTDFIPEMKELSQQHLDLALLPIGGHYTMDWQEAAEAANAIQATYTIPMHYRRLLGNQHIAVEEQFKKAVTGSEVIILEELA